MHSQPDVQTVRDAVDGLLPPIPETVQAPSPAVMGGDLPEGLPDGWTLDRDLPCPQCSYNLRSRREPSCPECGLRFRWQTLLGVVCPGCAGSLREERGRVCPHCFTTLDWPQIFGTADPRQQLEFEHSVHWVRPFVSTMLATLLPWRFWNRHRLDAPPNRARLIRFRTVAIGAGVAGLLVPLLARWAGLVYVDLMDWVALAAAVLLPPVICLSLIDRYGWSRVHHGLRWERTTRAVAMGAALLAWHGVIISVATAAAAIFNTVQPLVVNGGIRRPSNALRLSPDSFFNYLITGQSSYYWHPLEAWFNIGLGALLTLFAVAWWWPFLYLALHRSMKLRVHEAAPLLAAGLAASYLLVFVTWMHTIPLSPLVSWLTS